MTPARLCYLGEKNERTEDHDALAPDVSIPAQASPCPVPWGLLCQLPATLPGLVALAADPDCVGS